MKLILPLSVSFITLLFSFASAAAQERVINVTTSPAKEGEPFEVRIEPPQNVSINRAVVRFRIYGTSDYRIVEAQPEGNRFVAKIPGEDVLPPSIEFYVVVQLSDGTRLTYPVVSPESTPASVTVMPKPENQDLILISPERNAIVSEDDLVISFSFYRISDAVDRSKIQLFYDGVNVTSQAIISENMITYIPDRPHLGRSKVEIAVRDSAGNILSINSVVFTVISRLDVGQRVLTESQQRSVLFTSQNAAELRSERINDSTINYARVNLNLDATINFLKFGARLYVTNENQAFRQPANRFFGYISIPYAQVAAGDIFPEYTYYLSNGVRVRGVEVTAMPGPVRATVLVGNATDGYDAQFVGDRITIPVTSSPGRLDSINALLQRGFVRIDSSAAGETFQQRTALGTFTRNIFAAVAGVSSDFINFNLQVLRGSDDITGLNRFQIQQRGIPPQQNVAIGSSLKIIPVTGVAELFADVGFSLTNRDISSGSLTPRQLDELTGNTGIADRLQNLPIVGSYNTLTSIITINQNLSPILLLDLSSLAFRAGGQFNAFGNNLRLEYLRQGSQFNSFGLAFYLPDVQGFRISDRLRLLDNRLILSAAFESLSDNLLRQRNRILRTGSTLDATTTRSLFRFGASVFPGHDLPNVRVDFQFQNNKNNIGPTFRDSVGVGPNARLETFSGLALQNDNSTFSFTGNIQKAFTLPNKIVMTLDLTGVFTNRNDNRDLSLRQTGVIYTALDSQQVSQNFSSRALSLSGTFDFGTPLRLTANLTNQRSEFFVLDTILVGTRRQLGSQLRSQTFTAIDVSVGYWLLNSTLRPTLRANFNFGDFPRTQLGLNVLYDITQSIQLSGDVAASFVQAANVNGVAIRASTDIIAALRLQANFGN